MFVDSLKAHNIDYNELKSSLVPNQDRNEIALIFDIDKSGFSLYDYNILSKVLPLLNKKGSHSFLHGDFVGDDKRKDKLRTLFKKHIKQINPSVYKTHHQYYLIYINNLSKNMVQELISGLERLEYFTGYFDLTYSSKLKTYLSAILIPKFIKHKSVLIALEHCETNIIDEIEDSFCDFEELGLTCKFIHSAFYYIFLCYKIERKIIKRFEKDTIFSLNALSNSMINLANCSIVIEPSKLDYIHNNKADSIARAGLSDYTIDQLESLIKEKLANNYFYNLTFLEEHKILKFNIIIEVPRTSSRSLMKLLIALEYKPKENKLRLITMF